MCSSDLPFCRHKCDYCAFATFTDRAHLVERYLAALKTEIERTASGTASPGAAAAPRASTIFVGGGTPSLVDPQALARTLDAIPRRDDAEFTIECNPDDVTVDMLRTFRSIGVNRISLGMQSAREHVLLSLGRTHTAGLYFRKTALATPDTPTNKWETYVLVDGKQLEPQQSNALSFDTAGRLQSPLATLKFKPLALDNAGGKVDPLVLSLDLGKGTSQFSTGYSVRGVTQDGYGPGLIQQLSVDNAGVLKLALTNGRSVDLATIRTARFRNPAGLKPDGDGIFLATNDSGKPEVGVAGQGGFGAIQSGALERSNVELTDELIALVATQRNFSANAKAIQTMSDMEKNLADQA